jgi:O-antigen ligase
MLKKAENSALEGILIWTALLATLIVLPWTTFDPINVPKLAVISIGGFMAAGLLATNISLLKQSHNRLLVLIAGLFILDLLVVLFFSGNNFYQGLFGTFGRATGFVAYFSLTFLLLAGAIASSKSAINKFSFTLVVAGLLSNIYGFFQSVDADVFSWVNQYSPVIGFLGNPNFQSSFVGFSAISVFSFLISKGAKNSHRFAGLLYLILSLYVIKETDSQQGFLVLLGGIGIVILIWIPTSKFKLLTYPSLVLGLLGILLVTLGSLNKGPLASLLYKLSVTYRGDYWQAGWKMTVDNPFLGVGLDGYGDWYRRARTLEATLRRGPEVTSNAAHNVFLDLSSNGGFPLLIIYSALILLVFRSVFRILKRSKQFEPAITGLIAVWVAYLAQSVISLNQLGLAVWGWIISGLIIGYEIKSRESEPDSNKKVAFEKGKTVKKTTAPKLAAHTFMAMVAGLLIGALLGLPPVVASSKYLSALKSQNATQIESAAYIWPMHAYPLGQVAISLSNNNLQTQALKIIEDGVIKFPDEYSMWRLLSEIQTASPEQVAEAKIQMKRLDPLNPTLK